MEIREESVGTITVLGPVEHLDTRTSTEFEAKINEHLTTERTAFVIDFAELQYISSAGLRVLLMLAKKLKATNGRLILSSMNAHVREVFDVAGFTRIFEIEASKSDALGRLGAVSGEPAEDGEEVDSEVAKISALASRLMNGDAFRPARTDEVPLEVLEVATKAAELLGIAAQTRKARKKPPPPPADAPSPEPSAAAEASREDDDEKPGLLQRILRMLGIRRD